MCICSRKILNQKGSRIASPNYEWLGGMKGGRQPPEGSQRDKYTRHTGYRKFSKPWDRQTQTKSRVCAGEGPEGGIKAKIPRCEKTLPHP